MLACASVNVFVVCMFVFDCVHECVTSVAFACVSVFVREFVNVCACV